MTDVIDRFPLMSVFKIETICLTICSVGIFLVMYYQDIDFSCFLSRKEVSRFKSATGNWKLETTTMKRYYIISALLLPLLFTSGCGGLWTGKVSKTPSGKKKIAGTCIAGNCIDGEGKWRFDNGRVYEGTFTAGRPGGRGVLTLPSGAEYSGRFKYGQYDGDGDVLFADSTPAMCERGNCLNGRGIMRFEDDSVYSGEFKDGIRIGYSGMLFDDGSTYSGYFFNNLYHGKGTLTQPDSTEYTGLFLNGKMNGKITVTFPSKHIFIGKFKNNRVVKGQGVINFPNGLRGVCKKGNCITGKGLLKLEDGSKYKGDFEKCKRHGSGTFTLASGSTYKGSYLLGKRHGQGIFTFSSGLVYKGTYRDGKRHGEGTFIFPNDRKVEVFFNNGRME